MSRRDKPFVHLCRCQPQMVYVWTKRELQGWFDHHGPNMLYNGEMREPETKRLCPDRYRVKFVRCQP